MPKPISKAARDALAATNWSNVDAMTDEHIARQIASNPDAAPDMAPEIDVRAIRRAAGMTQAQFATAYEPKSGSWPIPLSVMAGTLQPVVGVHPGLRRSGG